MRRQLYEIQRAMRARREAALRRGVIAVLDIGTSKVACLVLQFVARRDRRGRRARPDAAPGRVPGDRRRQHPLARRRASARSTAMEEMRARRSAPRSSGAQKMAGLRVDHVIVCFSGGAARAPTAAPARSRSRTAPSPSATSAGCSPPARSPTTATTARRCTRCRSTSRSTTARASTDPRGQVGTRSRGRHAPRRRRRDAAANDAALHPALRPRDARGSRLVLRRGPREPRRGRAGAGRRLHRHRRRRRPASRSSCAGR